MNEKTDARIRWILTATTVLSAVVVGAALVVFAAIFWL
jgi:hypothetical protein